MAEEALCRYTANNFNSSMAKNAKLTIVEVGNVKRALYLTEDGFSHVRQRILFLLAQFPRTPSIYLASMSIALCKLPRRSRLKFRHFLGLRRMVQEEMGRISVTGSRGVLQRNSRMVST